MEFEIFLMILCTLFCLLAIGLSISAWQATEDHLRIVALAAKDGINIGGVLVLTIYTLWDGSLDFTPAMGPISLQSCLLFIVAVFLVLYLDEIQNIEEEARAQTH